MEELYNRREQIAARLEQYEEDARQWTSGCPDLLDYDTLLCLRADAEDVVRFCRSIKGGARQLTTWLHKITTPIRSNVPGISWTKSTNPLSWAIPLLVAYFKLRSGYKLLSKGTTNRKQLKKIKEFQFFVMNLSLAHANTSGFNLCPFSTAGCAASCIGQNGNGLYPSVQISRQLKARLFMLAPNRFIEMFSQDISRMVEEARRSNLTPVLRPNAFSDIPWERYIDFSRPMWDGLQVYDYTKIYKRLGNQHMTPNYDLTFSLSEKNEHHAKEALAMGFNVATVFFTPEFPATWNGHKVVDGDAHDFTFLHSPKHRARVRPVVIGLKAKGPTARRDRSGFVQLAG